MEVTENKKTKTSKSAWGLIFLCAVVYCLAYVGRLSYNANIPMVMDFFSVDKPSAGIVGTCLFISYALGGISEVFSWNVTFIVLLGACAIMMVLCVIFNLVKKIKG